MSNRAFEIINNILKEELENQGFGEPVYVKEDDGESYMSSLSDLAYCVKYEKAKKTFVLRSTTIVDGKPSDWKNLSSWLYDEETDTKSDIESIGKDFLDILRGPKRLAVTKKASKKKKGEEKDIDSLFFFNRVVGFIPELKDKMNEDRIVFAKIRYATLTKSFIVPEIEKIVKSNSAELEKLVAMLNEMYKNGDLDVRGLVIHGIYNSLSDEAMEKIKAFFDEDMLKVYKCSRPLSKKNIKPEKFKAPKTTFGDVMENAKQLEKEKKANSKWFCKPKTHKHSVLLAKFKLFILKNKNNQNNLLKTIDL